MLRGRPLRFDEYLAIVLYGEHGFYTTSGQAGRRGDFITSPEVGPLFAAVLARWIDAEHARIGAPDDFTIVEVGAGAGTLARSNLLAAPHWVCLLYPSDDADDLPRVVLGGGSNI